MRLLGIQCKWIQTTLHTSRLSITLLAELRRAKRANGAPWVIKFGTPSIRENLVMT